ncbi:MAG: aldo/keto reductase [Gemmatimonadales bacterium]|nr:aldo/keto reductase [Gemmatimonadales bacterium]
MSKKNPEQIKKDGLSRRHFLAAGSAAALGAAAKPSLARVNSGQVDDQKAPKIASYRTLGRTGFKVSDLSMGCGSISDPNVVRYAYDHGINLFDTAESYGNGDSESKIGSAMKHLDRSKIFIVTKQAMNENPDEQKIIENFNKSLERMKTPYADALYMHSITDVNMIGYEPFHSACDKLKAEGKLKHVGISSHGPRAEDPDAMDTVLIKAAEDGRCDVMLLSYGFVNKDEGERVLKACKEKNVGTTIMKSMTGLMEVPVLDVENPSEQIQGWFDYLEGQGSTREEAIERIKAHIERQKPGFEKSFALTKPFIEKHGIKTQDELDIKSLQWVLRNHDAHTICPSMPTFDMLDKFLPLSGTELSSAGMRFLDEYARVFGAYNCRFGCTDCADVCPENVPVSTILRYAYYFNKQGRQKHAMRKYADLGRTNASVCLDCNAPCVAACPQGVQAQARLFEAHGLLSLV